MNWSDENYVKLYTRESLTWRAWGWEARTVFLHLLKRVDHSGFIETGRMTPVEALVLQLGLPTAVVTPGLAELVESETVELVDRAILIPKFVEAQDARKSEAQKKRDERSRNIAKRRGSMSPAVTVSHPVSPAVTQTDPPAKLSSAKPSSAKLEKTVAEKPATDASALFVVWNSEKPAECPEVVSVTPGRIKHAMVRLRETQDLETWRAAIQRLNQSSFCKGLVPDSSWKANIDWLLRPDTLTKIIEGTYDDSPARKPTGKPRFDPDEGLMSPSHQCSDPACPECGPVLAAAGVA